MVEWELFTSDTILYGDAIYTYKVYNGICKKGGSFEALVKHNNKEFNHVVNGVAW